MRRILALSLLAASLSTGCCVAEKAADVAVNTAGKATSIALDAAFSSPSPASKDDDTPGPSNVVKRVTR
jgi:hypothetical protein